jgi:hypothetical protein
MTPLGWLMLGPTAHAAPQTATLCARYAVAYRDADPAVGDDFVTDNQPRAARGALIVVRDTGTHEATMTYLAEDGATPGCATLPLDDAATYSVVLKSTASVSGNLVRIEGVDGLLYGVVLDSALVPTGGTVSYVTPVRAHWNVAAVWGWALWKNPAGLVGEVLTAVVNAAPSGYIGGGAAYFSQAEGRVHYNDDLDEWPTDDKYIIAHELGHLIAFAKTSGAGWEHSYDADPEGCFTDAGRDHEANSKEHQSAAITEGIAHYYAAIAFNDRGDADCWFRYYKTIDYDLNGSVNFTDSYAAGWQAGLDPTSTSCQNHYEDYLHTTCFWNSSVTPPTTVGRGIEWDWLQFFWDLDQAGFDPADVYQVFADANPLTWAKEWDEGADSCADLPAQRSFDAVPLPLAVTWSVLATQNGTLPGCVP